MAVLVAFGEIMLRLSPAYGERLFQSDTLKTCFGGSEANVAVLCSRLGINAKYVTKLPDNAPGDAVLSELAKHRVDTSDVIRGGGRLGAYYYEKGAGSRPALCVYDRAYSAFSQSKRGEYDWEKLLDGASAFHFSGITPALSDELAAACLEACLTAKRRGVTVFCDLNYRAKLWETEKARDKMRVILPNVDVFISSVYQANELFELGADTENPDEACVYAARELTEAFGFKAVALTVRKTFSADRNGFYGMIYEDGKTYFSKKYETGIVDRVGSGDAFDGALIYSYLTGGDRQNAVEFASAAAVLKHSINGDFCLADADEIKAVASGGSGVTKR